MCELCCDAIEKDHDTLQCKGECGCTVHRYCAGVTKRHFEELNKPGSLPFVCQWCSLKSASITIKQLQSEVEALKTELATTKTTLSNLQNDRLQNPAPVQSYASVAARTAPRSKKQQQRRPPRSQSTTSSTNSQTSQTPREASSASASTRARSSPGTMATTNERQPRVKVEGARKVWATHPHATVKTVENVTSRFCNMQGLRIRRKTRRNGTSGRTIWWFVIHADEAVLSELDEKWDCVHVQTSWTLNQCTKPADTTVVGPGGALTSHTPPSDHEQSLTSTHADGKASGLHVQNTESDSTTLVCKDTDAPRSSFLDPTQDPISVT